MIGKINEHRCGVTPVMSQAGVVPGPMPRMGPPLATRGQHTRSRYVKVKQRKRIKERKQKPDQPEKTP